MNVKTTLILVGVLIVIGALWIFAPTHKEEAPKETPTTPEAQSELVFQPSPVADKLVRLELDRADQPRLVFERAGKVDPNAAVPEWRMLEPVPSATESWAVQGITSLLADLRSRAKFEPGAAGEPSAADAGLEPPRATLTATDDAGKTYKLDVGNKVVMSDDTYVRVAGQTTVMIAKRDLATQIKKPASDYRAKKLLDAKIDDVARMRIAFEGKSYSLTRGADGQWVFDEPVRAYADREKVRGLVTKLVGLRAEEFIADKAADLAQYGLTQPYLKYELTVETKRPVPSTEPAESKPAEPRFESVASTQQIAIGSPADLKGERRFAQVEGSPSVVSVNEPTIKPLIPNIKELRDPAVTRVKAADITSLELTWGRPVDGAVPPPVTLRKEGAGWQGTGDLASLDLPAITELLEGIEDLKAIDYVDSPEAPATYGLDKPRLTVVVTSTGAVEPLTLRIGSETASGHNAYVQRGQEPFVIVSTAAQASRVAIDPLTLRSREMFTFPVDQLQQMAVQRGELRYVVDRDGTTWKLTEPPETPIDAANVRVLATDLSRLRAKRVAGKGNDAAFGLDRPVITISFSVADRPAPPADAASQPAETQPASVAKHELRIGWGTSAAYANKDDDPFVYELDETIYKVMLAELIDARLFHFEAKDVVGVKTASTGGTLDLVKDGDQWKDAGDPYVQLDQKKVQDLVTDISQFRAEVFYAYRNGDLAGAGLLNAPATTTIKLASGDEIEMKMTPEKPGELPRKAGLIAERRIFKLRQADVEKLMRGLDEYLKTEPAPGSAQPPPGGMPPPGMPNQPPPRPRPPVPPRRP